jgi:hypothetical protein
MTSKCPNDFEEGLNDSCHMKCPWEFKYTQSGSDEHCVYKTDNSFEVKLNALPQFTEDVEPTSYANERTRVSQDIKNVLQRIIAKRELESQTALAESTVSEYERIQSQYAKVGATGNQLRDMINSLETVRPPTAPAEDLAKERRLIIGPSKQILLAQIALFSLLLGLLAFVFLPNTYAQFVAFLILCVGVAVGIFLSK